MLSLFIKWNVNPDIFTIFGREIRWYSLLWALGILGAAYIVSKIYKSEKLPEKWFDSLFWYVVIGVIIGARLGHCLFYDPIFYLTHPLEILKVWNGGLASHGGVIGIIIAVWLYSRKVTKKSMLWTFDRLVVGACLTATCIRIGNLMNSEIYGKPTTLPWGFEFIRDSWWHIPVEQGGSGALPCHPTQIYEALIYLALFCISMWLYWKTNAREKQGFILGICITGIFVSRFLIEFLKNVQEPFEIQMRSSIGIDMGQILSIPFIIWGVWLIWNAQKKSNIKINKNSRV